MALAGAGIALGTCAPSGGKAMLVWYPPRIRGFAMGLRQTSIPLAGVIAAPTLPLLALALGWRGAMVVGAVIGGVSALLVALTYHDPPQRSTVVPAHERSGLAAWPALLGDRSLLATILFGPLLVAGQWTVVPYLGLYLYERFGWPVTEAAAYLALAQVGGVVGRIGWGLASDVIWGGRRSGADAGAAAGSGGRGRAGAASPRHACLDRGAAGDADGRHRDRLERLATGVRGRAGGTASRGHGDGLAVSIVFLGAVIYPPAFGWLVDRAGSYQPAWLALAGFLLAGLALFPFMREVPRS